MTPGRDVGPPLTLGTAGHIDHGKTSLINALTGVNTDRLPEERSRGISIELGYAPRPRRRRRLGEAARGPLVHAARDRNDRDRHALVGLGARGRRSAGAAARPRCPGALGTGPR